MRGGFTSAISWNSTRPWPSNWSSTRCSRRLNAASRSAGAAMQKSMYLRIANARSAGASRATSTPFSYINEVSPGGTVPSARSVSAVLQASTLRGPSSPRSTT